MNGTATRCQWCGDDPLYVKYHDEEWGRPVTDNRTLFEFLTLESAQAGLAWITILRKRDGFRKASKDFDFNAVALMTAEDEARLRNFDGIVKNRLKIHGTIMNARLFKDIVNEYGSFFNYIISFFSFYVRNHASLYRNTVNSNVFNTLFNVVGIYHPDMIGSFPELSCEFKIAKALRHTRIDAEALVSRIYTQDIL